MSALVVWVVLAVSITGGPSLFERYQIKRETKKCAGACVCGIVRGEKQDFVLVIPTADESRVHSRWFSDHAIVCFSSGRPNTREMLAIRQRDVAAVQTQREAREDLEYIQKYWARPNRRPWS